MLGDPYELEMEGGCLKPQRVAVSAGAKKGGGGQRQQGTWPVQLPAVGGRWVLEGGCKVGARWVLEPTLRVSESQQRL